MTMHHMTERAILDRLDDFSFKIELVKDFFELGEEMDLSLDDASAIGREIDNLVLKAKAKQSMHRWKKAMDDFKKIRKSIDLLRDSLESLQDDLNEIEVKKA